MNAGDLVVVRWPDGLVVDGTYVGFTRGYHLIMSSSGNERVVCGPTVTIEKKNVDESKKKV